jgi:hypothetical protein
VGKKGARQPHPMGTAGDGRGHSISRRGAGTQRRGASHRAAPSSMPCSAPPPLCARLLLPRPFTSRAEAQGRREEAQATAPPLPQCLALRLRVSARGSCSPGRSPLAQRRRDAEKRRKPPRRPFLNALLCASASLREAPAPQAVHLSRRGAGTQRKDASHRAAPSSMPCSAPPRLCARLLLQAVHLSRRGAGTQRRGASHRAAPSSMPCSAPPPLCARLLLPRPFTSRAEAQGRREKTQATAPPLPQCLALRLRLSARGSCSPGRSPLAQRRRDAEKRRKPPRRPFLNALLCASASLREAPAPQAVHLSRRGAGTQIAPRARQTRH